MKKSWIIFEIFLSPGFRTKMGINHSLLVTVGGSEDLLRAQNGVPGSFLRRQPPARPPAEGAQRGRPPKPAGGERREQAALILTRRRRIYI